MGIQNVLAVGLSDLVRVHRLRLVRDDVGSDGIVPMPQPDEKVLGGHAVVAVGYKHDQGAALLRVPQFLGPELGRPRLLLDAGGATSRARLASDFWVIQQVE